MKEELDEFVKEHGIKAAGSVLLETEDYRVVLEIKMPAKAVGHQGTFAAGGYTGNYNGNVLTFNL